MRESAELLPELSATEELLKVLPDLLKRSASNLEDDEEYKTFEEDWRKVRNERLRIEKVHKKAKEPFVKYGKVIDEAKNRGVGQLKPVEEWLRKQMYRFEAYKEEREQAYFNKVHQSMLDTGYVFHGGNYICGSIVISADDFKKDYKNPQQMNYWLTTGAEMKKVVEKQLAEQAAVVLDDKPPLEVTEESQAETVKMNQVGQPESKEPVRYPDMSKFEYEKLSYNKGLFDAAKLASKMGYNEIAKAILNIRKP